MSIIVILNVYKTVFESLSFVLTKDLKPFLIRLRGLIIKNQPFLITCNMRAFYSLFTGFLLFRFSIGSSARHYCQPGESCWPTVEEVDQFKSYLSPADEECHSLPTFSSFDEPGKLPIKHILLFKF